MDISHPQSNMGIPDNLTTSSSIFDNFSVVDIATSFANGKGVDLREDAGWAFLIVYTVLLTLSTISGNDDGLSEIVIERENERV